MTDREVHPEDALQVAQRALSTVNDLQQELDEVRESHEEAVEEVRALRLRLSEIDAKREYDALSRAEKIGKVRAHAYERAVEGHGRSALDYHDIQWGVFDGEPGASHCYDLMRWAAAGRGDGTAPPGFDLRDPENGNRRLVCDAERAERGPSFSPEKNRRPGGGH